MLSSNQTLQCLDIKGQYRTQFSLLFPVEYVATGLRENNTLQELDIDITTSENVKEFFEATNNLKSLTVSFCQLRLWKVSHEKIMPWYHEKLIPYVTNMLKRNKDMKFLSVEVFFHQILQLRKTGYQWCINSGKLCYSIHHYFICVFTFRTNL